MKKIINILFVDDEAQILRGIRRMLSFVCDEWDVTFADSGSEALDVMKTKPFDVIVSDIRMPGMDGATLLNIVKERHPQVIRLALSGQTSKEVILKTVGPVHQYLSKPCNTQTLKDTITHVCSLRELLNNEKILGLITRLESLPCLPFLYTELMQELRSEEASIGNVARIISQDVGISVKILQIVNSSFFGIRQNVSKISQAVSLLGLEIITSLALSTKIFKQFEQITLDKFSLSSLWEHSLTVGKWAKSIASVENSSKETVDYAMIAGMLHDVGKLVLASKMPDEYEKVLALADKERIPIFEAEKQVIDATHAEVGAYLLGLWGFSNSMIETLSFHHRPSEAATKEFTVLAAVHVADILVHKSSSSYNVI